MLKLVIFIALIFSFMFALNSLTKENEFIHKYFTSKLEEVKMETSAVLYD